MKTAKQLLQEAEDARNDPKRGPDVCLGLIDGVREAAEREGDKERYVHSFCTEAIAHKLNFQRKHHEADLASMMSAGKAMLQLALQNDLPGKIGTANFVIATAYAEKQQWEESLPYYAEAAKFCQEDEAECADWERHWGGALIRAGKKVKGEEIFWKALGDLDEYQDTYQGEIRDFKIPTWRSGGYMDAGEIYFAEDNLQALQYLETAERIIEKYNLTERRRQLADLKKRLRIAA